MTKGSTLLKSGIRHGTPYQDPHGYYYAWDPVRKRNWRLHRLVMEEYLGRTLSRDEHVHHKNGDKADNHINNLEVVTMNEHLRMHGHDPERIKVICPKCGVIRLVPKFEAGLLVFGACLNCKNTFTNQARTRHILHFWVVWPTGEVLGPYPTRREAYSHTPKVNRKGKSIATLNTQTGNITCRKVLSSEAAAAIRARGGNEG